MRQVGTRETDQHAALVQPLPQTVNLDLGQLTNVRQHEHCQGLPQQFADGTLTQFGIGPQGTFQIIEI